MLPPKQPLPLVFLTCACSEPADNKDVMLFSRSARTPPSFNAIPFVIGLSGPCRTVRRSGFALSRHASLLLTAATSAVLAFIRRTEFPLSVHGRSTAQVEPLAAALELCARKWTNLGLAPELQQLLSDCHRKFHAWGQLLRPLLPLTSGSP